MILAMGSVTYSPFSNTCLLALNILQYNQLCFHAYALFMHSTNSFFLFASFACAFLFQCCSHGLVWQAYLNIGRLRCIFLENFYCYYVSAALYLIIFNVLFFGVLSRESRQQYPGLSAQGRPDELFWKDSPDSPRLTGGPLLKTQEPCSHAFSISSHAAILALLV